MTDESCPGTQPGAWPSFATPRRSPARGSDLPLLRHQQADLLRLAAQVRRVGSVDRLAGDRAPFLDPVPPGGHHEDP